MTTQEPSPGNKTPTLTKTLVPVVAIALAATAALWFVRGRHEPPVSVPAHEGPAEMRVGAVLPDFLLRDFKSESDIAASSLKSKIRLINFWATWCEACMVEMPSIVKVHEAYKDRGFEVVAINLDTNPQAVVPRTITKYAMPFPIYQDVDSRLADLFDIQSIPLSVVIDSGRKILMIEREGLDWNGADFRGALEKWLSG